MVSLRSKMIEHEDDTTVSSPIDHGISPEIYRELFTSLELSVDSHPVIGITSAISGEGRTTIATGLARTLAADLDSLVSLVDADLDHPSLAEHFDLDTTVGLADVLRGERDLSSVTSLVASNLCVIAAGAAGGETAALLHQLSVSDPFHSRQGPRGVMIVDLPPILDHGYTSVSTQVADAVILVVRAGVTPIEIVREAIARLGDRPPHGVVLNGARSTLPSWWPEIGI